MGLVGWADSPNSEENNTFAPNGAINVSEMNGTATTEIEEIVQLEEQNSASSDIVTDEDAGSMVAQLTEEYSEQEGNPISNEAQVISVEDVTGGLQEELFKVISQLKLRENSSTSTCDISKIELREVKFVLDHAAGTEKLDYYRFARAIHRVKHQLLNAAALPDSIESPNLDELIGYIEDQYYASINEAQQYGRNRKTIHIH